MTDKTATELREGGTLARQGLIVTTYHGERMINARLVEELVERHERAFKSLLRAIQSEGFDVNVDVDGLFTIEKRPQP